MHMLGVHASAQMWRPWGDLVESVFPIQYIVVLELEPLPPEPSLALDLSSVFKAGSDVIQVST